MNGTEEEISKYRMYVISSTRYDSHSLDYICEKVMHATDVQNRPKGCLKGASDIVSGAANPL